MTGHVRLDSSVDSDQGPRFRGHNTLEFSANKRQKKVFSFSRLAFCCNMSSWIMALAAFVLICYMFFVILMFLGTCLAQMSIDATSVTVNNMSVHTWTNNSFIGDVNCTMDNRSPISGRSAETIIYMGFEGKAFASFVSPAMDLNPGFNLMIIENQEVTIVDLDVFNAFSAAMIEQRFVTVNMIGSMTVTSMGLTFKGLNMQVNTEIRGFYQFADTPPRVVKSDVLYALDDKRMLVKCTMEMTNPGTMSMYLGRLRMEMAYMKKMIGIVTSDKAITMKRGTQTVEMTAIIHKTDDNDAEMDAFMTNYASGETLLAEVNGLTYMDGHGATENENTPLIMRASCKKIKLIMGVLGLSKELTMFPSNFMEMTVLSQPTDEWYDSCRWAESTPGKNKKANTNYMNAYVAVHNPFSVGFTVYEMDAKAYIEDSLTCKKSMDAIEAKKEMKQVMEAHGIDRPSVMVGHETRVVKQHVCIKCQSVEAMMGLMMCSLHSKPLVHMQIGFISSFKTCFHDKHAKPTFCQRLSYRQTGYNLYANIGHMFG